MTLRIFHLCGYTLLTLMIFGYLPFLINYILSPLFIVHFHRSQQYTANNHQDGGVQRRQTECDVSLCEYTEWSDWTFCYCAICNEFDNATRRSCLRIRTVSFTPDGCQDDECETDSIGDLQCFEECCNTHCGVTEWGEWLSCNNTCHDNGVESRTRSPYPNECFTTCDFQETRPCDGYCETEEWSAWTCFCDLCEPDYFDNETIIEPLIYGGNETLHRNCTRSRSPATVELCEGCDSITFEENVCMENCSCDSSISCLVNDWGSWSDCPVPCGGNQVRSRTYSSKCTAPPCSGTQQSRQCTECPTCTPCDYADWSQWSVFVCTLCDNELRNVETRSQTVSNPDCNNECPDVQETQCGDTCCDELCVLTDWTDWSSCIEPCGGSQARTREPISCLGEPCSVTEETMECPACVGCELCELSEWTSWSCSCQLCDITDIQLKNQCSRTRFAVNECDTSCFDSVEVSCDTKTLCCDDFCLISSWTDWRSCSEPCGGTRNRTAEYDASFCLGEPCEETIEFEPCVPCPATEWGEWSCSCSLCQNTLSLGNICIRERSYSRDTQCNINCTELVEVRDCTDPCCDEFCLPEEWGEWTTCPQPCGGTSNRTRQYSATFCLGEPCESLFESQDCPTCPNCLPIDCNITQWTEWSQCNNSCDFGTQHRSREITVASDCGGIECPSIDQLEEVRACEGECQLSEWGSWQCTCSICSGFLDSLYNVCTRQRVVSGPSFCSTVDCAVTIESGCTDKCCDSFCSVSDWSSWSVCSSGCGSGETGTQSRTRTYVESLCIGEPCDDTYEERICTPDVCCPVDCTTTQWNDWSACSVTCASESGIRTRNREVTQATCGGNICTDTETEETQECVGECQLLEWSSWSCFCWLCNDGDSVLSNICSRSRQEFGTGCNTECGSLTERVCNDICCDNNCITGEWSMWSSCDQPCDSGINGNETRTRTYNQEFCIGEPCDHLTETRVCDPGCCSVDCSFSEWSDWSDCSVICSEETGSRSRTRGIQEALCGGAHCENDITIEVEACLGECVLSAWSEWECFCSQCSSQDTAEYEQCTRSRTESNSDICGNACGELTVQECHDKCCDPNCSVSDWGEWTECNVPCESMSPGIKQRTRNILGTCVAEPCIALEETITCEASCCARDCVLLSWEDWSICTSLCANTPGTRTRTRSIVQGSCGGNICTNSDYTETGLCYGTCDISEWSDWSCVCGVCSSNILQNICSRYRNESTDATCSGHCGSSLETLCVDPCCDESCTVGEWTEWTDCSEPCGSGNTGIQTRQRVMISQTCRGEPCDSLSETRECFQGSGCCPVDCQLGVWSTWSSCSVPCSSEAGNKTRTREITTQDSCGGIPCSDSNIEYTVCHGTTSPANCIEGSWSTWSLCALDNGLCGTGTRQRFRYVIFEAVCGGLACGPLTETENCQGPCCPIDCTTTPWTDWTVCSTECGIGQEMRFRMITTAAECGGARCLSTFDRRECIGIGPSVCEVTDWSDWTTCSSSCGFGGQSRRRSILTPVDCREQCSSTLTEQNQGCERFVNVDCQVGDWSQWSSCVPDCFGFTKSRNRNVLVYNSCNGEICPSLTETSNCNIFCQHSCSGDGQCSCNTGFQLTGSLSTECSPLTCQPPVFYYCSLGVSTGSCFQPIASCGTGTSFEYNHICQLSCESRSGYSYELMGAGPGYIQCLSTGQWSYYTQAYCTIVNNPPTGLTTFSGNTISVSENTIGNVLAVLRTEDADSDWDTYTYTVVDDPHNIITIVENQIYLRSALDYELQDRYTVTLRSTDSAGYSVDQEFIFQVIDANDSPTGVSISNNKVAENSVVNTGVGLLQAVDQDTGQSYTYSLVDDAHGRFKVVGNLLQTAMSITECQQLFNDACFNYEMQQYHDVIVSVQDDGNPMKTEYYSLRIYVDNMGEELGILQISSNVIDKSFPPGSVIGVVSSDDTSSDHQYIYSLLYDYNGLFRIDPVSGAVILEDPTRIDYATQQSYTVQVKAVDTRNPTNTVTEEFVLDVTQGNTASTKVTILSTSGSESYPVNEPVVQAGTQSGEVIGAVVVYDYESGDVSVDLEGGIGLYETRKMYCYPVNGQEQGYRTVCLYELYVTSDIISQSQGSVITLTSTNAIGQTTRNTFNIDVTSSMEVITTVDLFTTQSTTPLDVTSAPPILVFSGDSRPSESLTSNTPIGSITTTDFSNQYTYSIVNDVDGIFQLQGNVLYLSPTAQLDYETASKHEVTIQAVQNGDPSKKIQMTFAFHVEDTNEAPTSIDFSNTQVEFNAEVGTTVATLTVNDPDNSGGTIQDSECYITEDVSGVFTINGHSLETTRSLIPGQSKYFLQVRCIDNGAPSLYIDSPVIIDVLVDDPIDIEIVLTDYTPISENIGPSSVGRFQVKNTATGHLITDEDFNYLMLFMGDIVPFTIMGDQLFTTTPLNYEESSNFVVTVQARGTDSYGRELTAVQEFPIDVVDTWEAPKEIAFAATDLQLSTDNQIGDVIGTLGATGEDSDYRDIVYTITGVNTGSSNIEDPALADLVTIDGNTLRIGEGIENVMIDGDSEQFEVRITVGSTTNTDWSTEIVQMIEIFKINHPPIDIVMDDTKVMENVATGSHVGYLSMIDPDTEDSGSCQVLNKDDVPFDITESNELVTSGMLDFETFYVYFVQVQCSDSDGQSFTKTFEISVENILEPPSFLSLSNIIVREDVHEGETVGQLYSLVEQGHWVTYSVVQQDVPFEIAGNNTLIITDTMNYEDVSRYDITIAAALGDEPSLVTYTNFTILIEDLNDPPVVIQLNPSTFSIAENAVDGTVVGRLIAIDEDKGQSHYYHILSDLQGTGAFDIKGDQLILVDSSALDYETHQYIELLIETVDDGDPAQSFQELIRVQIIDTGEPPKNIIYQTPTLPENSPSGTLVTRLLVDDPDNNEKHTCSVIRTDTYSGLFEIIRISNDDIRLVVAEEADIDYETRPYHRVEIECGDGYNWIRKTITVFVDDINEPPEGVDLSGAHSILIDADAGYVIGQLQVHDPDIDQSHTISVIGEHSGIFKVEGNSLLLRESIQEGEGVLDASNPFLQVILEVVDNGPNMLSRTQAYTIGVTGLTDFELDGNVVSELSSPGHPIGRFMSNLGSYGTPQYRLLNDADGTFSITDDYILVLSSYVNYTDSPHLFIEGEMQSEGVKKTRMFRISVLPEDPCSTGFAQCLPHSQCERLSKTEFVCVCHPGYNGINGQCFAVDDCATLNGNPCTYSTPCLDGDNSFSCVCPEGYQGKLCEFEPVDPCHSQPCLNDGKCLYSSDYKHYICECKEEFTGENCQYQIQDQPLCKDVNCGSGECIQEDDAVVCQCSSSYYGVKCQYAFGVCSDNICNQDEYCIPYIRANNGFICAPRSERVDINFLNENLGSDAKDPFIQNKFNDLVESTNQLNDLYIVFSTNTPTNVSILVFFIINEAGTNVLEKKFVSCVLYDACISDDAVEEFCPDIQNQFVDLCGKEPVIAEENKNNLWIIITAICIAFCFFILLLIVACRRCSKRNSVIHSFEPIITKQEGIRYISQIQSLTSGSTRDNSITRTRMTGDYEYFTDIAQRPSRIFRRSLFASGMENARSQSDGQLAQHSYANRQGSEMKL